MNTRLHSLLVLSAALSVSALVPLSASDHGPKAITKVAPDYSVDLRKAEVEGAVLVDFTITPQGDVADPVILNSTDQAFEEPTLNAVRKWKFAPATKDGLAVSTHARQLVHFELRWLDTAPIVLTAPRLVPSTKVADTK